MALAYYYMPSASTPNWLLASFSSFYPISNALLWVSKIYCHCFAFLSDSHARNYNIRSLIHLLRIHLNFKLGSLLATWLSLST